MLGKLGIEARSGCALARQRRLPVLATTRAANPSSKSRGRPVFLIFQSPHARRGALLLPMHRAQFGADFAHLAAQRLPAGLEAFFEPVEAAVMTPNDFRQHIDIVAQRANFVKYAIQLLRDASGRPPCGRSGGALYRALFAHPTSILTTVVRSTPPSGTAQRNEHM